MLGAGPKQGWYLARVGNDADRPRLHNPKGKLGRAATALLRSSRRSRPALRRTPRIDSLAQLARPRGLGEQALEAYKTLMLERSGGKLSSGYSYPTKGTYTIDILGERGWLERLQDRLPRWGRKSAPTHTHVMHVQAQLQGDRLYMLHVLQPDPPSYNQELYANRTLRSFQIAKK